MEDYGSLLIISHIYDSALCRLLRFLEYLGKSPSRLLAERRFADLSLLSLDILHAVLHLFHIVHLPCDETLVFPAKRLISTILDQMRGEELLTSSSILTRPVSSISQPGLATNAGKANQ